MSDARERLIRCFQAVFPGLSEGEAANASIDNVGDWDSVATVTLAAVVEEEFAIDVVPEEFEKLTSFQAILDRLSSRGALTPRD